MRSGDLYYGAQNVGGEHGAVFAMFRNQVLWSQQYHLCELNLAIVFVHFNVLSRVAAAAAGFCFIQNLSFVWPTLKQTT